MMLHAEEATVADDQFAHRWLDTWSERVRRASPAESELEARVAQLEAESIALQTAARRYLRHLTFGPLPDHHGV